MTSKRSYLGTLNAGRPRRSYTSLEDLNRSLENLEHRLERNKDDHRETEKVRPARVKATPAVEAAPAYGALARDMERVRGHENGIVQVEKIADELQELRDELRHQLTAGLRREFEGLRKDIIDAFEQPGSGKDGAVLTAEFERLSDSIHDLSERSDDRSINMLRLEVEQVKGSLESLAREETVRSVDRRWDDFDRRWTSFEDRLSQNAARPVDDPEIAALHSRLEHISQAVGNLPESLSLKSLEEKVRGLATAVDQFSRQDRRGTEAMAQIEERLDEISRAIVASAAAMQQPSFDPQPFERIEARITSLARQIEELVEDRPTGEVIERLNGLSERVDGLAARADLPEKAVERLAQQVALIARKLDQAPDTTVSTQILSGIEHRFDRLSDVLEQRQDDAVAHSHALFQDLEQRLEAVAQRLDSMPATDTNGIMAAIDTRFADFARHLDARGTAAEDALFDGLAARLDTISQRLDHSAAQLDGIDPGLILKLESQVAGLSDYLARPAATMPDLEDLGPRFDEIERSIADQKEAILEAARQAAEDAVHALSNTSGEPAAVAGLASDFRTLESLTRRSDERNAKTFEAIHDTLLKIVDRLSASDLSSHTEVADGRRALQSTPAIDASDADDVMETADRHSPAVTRTPAEAAAAAAVAALNAETTEEQPPRRKRSLLGGLFGGRKEAPRDTAEPDMVPSAATVEPDLDLPSVEPDQPLDPILANHPLEPGSGAPDLSAIMKRVREERGQPGKAMDAETAKSDFIAAARRAAQAAAAEADIAKNSAAGGGQGGRMRFGGLFRPKRKTVLLSATAIMLALTGMQLGKAFLAEDRQFADAGVMPTGDDRDVVSAGMDRSPDDRQAKADTPAPATASVPVAAPAKVAPPADVDDVLAAADSEISEPVSPHASTAALPETDTAPEATPQETASLSAPTPAAATTTAAPATETPAAATISVPADSGPQPLREAAQAGDPKALFEIGARYAEGRGAKADQKKAAEWYEKSAELGLAPAQYRIGNFYEKAIGVDRDVKKAKTWYQMAAAQGNASAMHNLAVLFAMGTDGAVDNESAVRWFTEAANLGVKDSQFNLGILAAKGVGMKQNLEDSYKWFALVAKGGDHDAETKRDEIAKALKPDQLERARGATDLWRPKPVDAETNRVEIPDSWQESGEKTAGIDMKKAVQNIQLILNKNGYDAGGADGMMGGKTKTAIAKFQSDNGMEPTGEVNEKLVRTLLDKK